MRLGVLTHVGWAALPDGSDPGHGQPCLPACLMGAAASGTLCGWPRQGDRPPGRDPAGKVEPGDHRLDGHGETPSVRRTFPRSVLLLLGHVLDTVGSNPRHAHDRVDARICSRRCARGIRTAFAHVDQRRQLR